MSGVLHMYEQHDDAGEAQRPREHSAAASPYAEGFAGQRPILLIGDVSPESVAVLGAVSQAGYPAVLAPAVADCLRVERMLGPWIIIVHLDLDDEASGRVMVSRLRSHGSLAQIVVVWPAGSAGSNWAHAVPGAALSIVAPVDGAALLAWIARTLGVGAVTRVPLMASALGHPGAAVANAPLPRSLLIGRNEVLPLARTVYRGGEEVHLTPSEWDALLLLCERAGTAVCRRDFRLAGRSAESGRPWRGVDSIIQTLRAKLQDGVGTPSRIRTVRGIGYRLDL